MKVPPEFKHRTVLRGGAVTGAGAEGQNDHELTGIFDVIDWELKTFNSKWHKNILLYFIPVFELGFYA